MNQEDQLKALEITSKSQFKMFTIDRVMAYSIFLIFLALTLIGKFSVEAISIIGSLFFGYLIRNEIGKRVKNKDAS